MIQKAQSETYCKVSNAVLKNRFGSKNGFFYIEIGLSILRCCMCA
jgi:hypothetical protein